MIQFLVVANIVGAISILVVLSVIGNSKLPVE